MLRYSIRLLIHYLKYKSFPTFPWFIFYLRNAKILMLEELGEYANLL
jgi:hypothetical protein